MTETFAEQLLALATATGAEAAEVYEGRSHARPISFEANRLKQVESTSSQGTALRLWREGRPGLAVAYGEVDPQSLVDRALAISALNEPEEIELNQTAPPAVEAPAFPDPPAVEDMVAQAEEAIAHIRDRYPEVLCNGEWDLSTGSTRLINSYGLDCSYEDMVLGASLAAEWVRGDDFLTVDNDTVQRHTIDVDALVQPMLQHLAWAEENATIKTPKLPVVLTSKAADLLWDVVVEAANGKRVLENASPWSDRLGQSVVASLVTLTQQPDAAPHECPFDDEGTPTQAMALVERGVLQHFYCDRTTGKKLGTGTTGNGFRPGLSSYPMPGLFNLIVIPGARSLADLIASFPDCLLIDRLLGQGADISGDFSVNVELGYYVRGGTVLGRVKDTAIAGNAYDCLKRITELSADAEWNGMYHTPAVAIESVSVTGK